MDLALLLLAFSLFWKSSTALRCYTCEPRSSNYHSLQPKVCENFEASDYYTEECVSSTMCFKRLSTIDFGNGVTTTTYHRGCAPQSFSGDQVKINGKWKYVNNIYEVYEENCQTDKNSDSLASTVNCYCRGDLCNAANSIDRYSIIYLITIALMMIIVR